MTISLQARRYLNVIFRRKYSHTEIAYIIIEYNNTIHRYIKQSSKKTTFLKFLKLDLHFNTYSAKPLFPFLCFTHQ